MYKVQYYICVTKANNMTTLINTATRKTRTVEVIYSNMTFIVEANCHYMAALNNPGWSANKYTAKIKSTGENIGGRGDIKLIRRQMELINSKPHLFL